MARLAVLIVVFALPACFYDPEFGRGLIACDRGACPSDHVCGGDDRCYPDGPGVTVSVTVEGGGRVTSLPAGVDCIDGCTGEFPRGVPIVLVAEGNVQARFEAWTGCTPLEDDRECMLIPDGPATVTATFTASGGATAWQRSFGGAASDEAYGIAVQQWLPGAPNTAFVIGGYGSSSIEVAPGKSITNGGEDDMFVVGVGPSDGMVQAVRGIGGTGFDNIWGGAVDIDGNVVVTGYAEEQVDFGGGVRLIPSGYDAYVANYDATGAWKWDHVFPCDGEVEDEGNSIMTDFDGNVVVTGVFAGTCDFGDSVIRTAVGPSPFVVKLDGTTGMTMWVRDFAVTAGGAGHGGRVAVATDGDVVVVGAFKQELTAGPSDTLTSMGADDVFAIKLNGATGATTWARRFGSIGSDVANAVAIDSNGNVYVAGHFQETVDFGNGARTSKGLSDVFLVKQSAAGVPAWDITLGGSDDDDAFAVAVDTLSSDDVVIGGTFSGSVQFGGDATLTSAGALDGFVARFSNAGGAPLWVRPFGAGENDAVYDVTVASSTQHQILVTGSFRKTVDFGLGPLVSQGEEDVFVIALQP